ncbi:MAG: transglycosylase SLT domain-containing protein [Anaerolineae bacterium]|nr:transglycosylase SLT domain-containing protein [Anaerolineae bacterium]
MTDQLNTTPKPPRRRKTAAEGESTPSPVSTPPRKAVPKIDAASNPFNPTPRAVTSKAPSKATAPKEKVAVAPKPKAKKTAASATPPPAPSFVQTLLRAVSKLLGRMFLWLVRSFWRLNWRFKLVSVILTAALLGGSYLWLQQVMITTSPVIASFFPPSVRYWASSIARWSQQYDVDPNLIATLMQIESCGWTTAESYAAAQGLFQVMPMHFSEEEKISMTDPEVNARRGMGVIKDCLDRSDGDVGLAMACYNGGPRLINLDQSAWPEQSQRYYYWGTGIYGDAQAGRTQSPRLQEWLAAGGQSLCQRAEAALNLPISTDIPFEAPNIVTNPPPTAALPTMPASSAPIATLPPSSDLPTFDPNRR